MMMKSKYEEYLREKPEYVNILKRIIKYEEENKDKEHHHTKDTEYDVCWEYDDVGASPQKLYQLTINGFLDKLFDSNSSTVYTLKDREELKDVISNIGMSEEDGDMMKEMHDFPSEEDLPDGLFDDVIGYEDVKWVLKRAITTDDIVNILLVGPPGSAKTVFLLSMQDLDGAEFVSGKSSSGPGVLDVMFERTPKYLAVDEFDDVDNDTQKVLSQHMDTGIVDETKHNKDRTLKTNTNTFASANSTDGIIKQVEDRFVDLHFDPYTKEEFDEICRHLLPRREDVTKDEASVIADKIWEIEGEANVRKAISVARLSRGDPEKVISILDQYSENSDMLF